MNKISHLGQDIKKHDLKLENKNKELLALVTEARPKSAFNQ